MACTDDGRVYYWASGCFVNGDITAYLTAFAHIGFHFFGDAPGTWLTQILGQVKNGDYYTANVPENCPESGFYVSIIYINATTFRDYAGIDLVTPGQTAAQFAAEDLAFRTDNNIIEHGYDLFCDSQNRTYYIDCLANYTHAYNEPDDYSYAQNLSLCPNVIVPKSRAVPIYDLQYVRLLVLCFMLLLW
ncbi:hypothetical protein B0O99DRAFT_109932 [Bisporella sp. PMI_857]|nr:hypothetical protein B0O99DRAFT_109932 [Bisporella sp. PMI_857]